jgi:peptidoglycan/LPS O-acetylase OafA/YrhL
MPVFYAYVLISLLLLTLTHKAIPWAAVGSSLVYALNYYQGLTGAPMHFLSHCWSLAVEEQFYFLWPITLILLVRVRWRLDTSIAVSIVAVWAYRAALQLGGHASDDYIYRALETRADQLLIGCLLAVLLRKAAWRAWFERLASPPARSGMYVLGLFAVLAACAAFDHILNFRYTVGYVIEPVATAVMLPLIMILAQRRQGLFSKLANASLTVKMGQASYGIYLFHQLLLYSFEVRLSAFAGGSKVAGFILAVMALSLLAHLSYTYFEMPLRKRLNHTASSS